MKLEHSKKAEMGVGTLIIFIALLLVAAVAAGVLIQTSGSLQERALTTGDQAKSQISTNVKIIEVSATDGGDGELEFIEKLVRLSPGSDAIKFSQVLVTVNTYDATATLEYRGTSGVHEENVSDGYYTIYYNETLGNVSGSTYNLSEDYDLDGLTDTVTLNAAGNLNFTFSGGNNLVVTGFECNGTITSITGNYSQSGTEIETIRAIGSCGGGSTGNATIYIIPDRSGEGFFTAEYLQTGNNHVVGNLQTGDIVKIYLESPRAFTEDEEVRINFIPKIGTPTLTQFITPEVISSERVYLYP